jgi:hypothetical protein
VDACIARLNAVWNELDGKLRGAMARTNRHDS